MGLDSVCIIPARGGSRGIPKKNIAPLMGKPLIAWTIEQAKMVPEIDDVIVSTDDQEIGRVAASYGAVVIDRPAAISGDYSPSEDAIKDVLSAMAGWDIPRPDIVVMLQATSPIRTATNIEDAIHMVKRQGFDSVLSAVRLHQFVWRDAGEGAYSLNYNPMAQRPMRQSVVEYVENGSMYVFRTKVLLTYGTRLGGKIGIVEMPYWSRFEIDTQDDLELVEWIMRRQT